MLSFAGKSGTTSRTRAHQLLSQKAPARSRSRQFRPIPMTIVECRPNRGPPSTIFVEKLKTLVVARSLYLRRTIHQRRPSHLRLKTFLQPLKATLQRLPLRHNSSPLALRIQGIRVPAVVACAESKYSTCQPPARVSLNMYQLKSAAGTLNSSAALTGPS